MKTNNSYKCFFCLGFNFAKHFSDIYKMSDF
jgi:hypothetical protein